MTPPRASSCWPPPTARRCWTRRCCAPAASTAASPSTGPNLAGRLATLQVHTRSIKLAEDVDLKKVALATAGCVGADLANLVNEAALRAVRKGRKLVTQEDLLAAFELVIAGTREEGQRPHRV